MKSTKKTMFIAGLVLLLQSTSIFADWASSFAAFGGPETVFNTRQKMIWTEALKIAKAAGGSPTDLAVAAYVSKGNQAIHFPGAAPESELKNNLFAAREANSSANAVAPAAPIDSAPAKSSGWGWLSGSSAASAPSAPAAYSQADLDAARADQQKRDAQVSAGNSQDLQAIISSNRAAVDTYKAYVDVIFNLLQDAVNAIVDTQTQAQVISYIQSKVVSLKASAASSKYNSQTLGRMTSKKASKKSKSKRS